RRDSGRVHPRVDVEIEVTLESESNFYVGLTENMSVGGLFIATHLVKPMGTTMEVLLKLPDEKGPIRVTGTVRWVRMFSDSSDTSPGMGVRFGDMDAANHQRIRAFLDERPPLFHDSD